MSSALNVQEIVEYYDQCQVDYEEFWHLHAQMCMHYGYWDESTLNLRSALTNMNAKVAAFGGVKTDDKVLDAGCGVGGSSIYLATHLGCSVTGITLSAKQVEKCKQNAKKHAASEVTTFSVENYQNMSFADNSFDVVWGIESVCYADDKINFLKEAFRVLKPGGRLVVADFFSNNVEAGSSDAELMQRWTQSWAIMAYADIEEFWNKMSKAGFINPGKQDVTRNVIKSIRRLFLLFYPGLVYMYVKYLLGLRTKENLLNAWSTYYQYQAYKRDLWRYMFFTAEKPTS